MPDVAYVSKKTWVASALRHSASAEPAGRKLTSAGIAEMSATTGRGVRHELGHESQLQGGVRGLVLLDAASEREADDRLLGGSETLARLDLGCGRKLPRQVDN